ncbi:MAG: hypothetical protein ACOVP4_08990 [Bacteriovoracaceae bacterium]
MKKSMLIVLAFAALTLVACNKSEQAAEGTAPEATAAEQAVGHDVEHQHVEANPDHTHDDAHHGDHDHKAHHPDHQE